MFPKSPLKILCDDVIIIEIISFLEIEDVLILRLICKEFCKCANIAIPRIFSRFNFLFQAKMLCNLEKKIITPIEGYYYCRFCKMYRQSYKKQINAMQFNAMEFEYNRRVIQNIKTKEEQFMACKKCKKIACKCCIEFRQRGGSIGRKPNYLVYNQCFHCNDDDDDDYIDFRNPPPRRDPTICVDCVELKEEEIICSLCGIIICKKHIRKCWGCKLYHCSKHRCSNQINLNL